MEKSFFVSDRNPILESREEMSFFDYFFIPQFWGDLIEMFKDLVLTGFNNDFDSLFLKLIDNNFGAVNFLRSILQSFIEIIRTDISKDKRFVVL